MSEKNRMIKWVKSHKKQLLVAGFISIASLIAIIALSKNREALKLLWESLKKSIEPTAGIISEDVSVNVSEIATEQPSCLLNTEPRAPFEVSRHIRNLPNGQHPSPEKKAEACRLNINLGENQTLVDNYMKGECAA